jgi:hypothetical protein
MGLKIINAQQVIGDFRKYDKKTQQRFERTMRTYAKLIEGEQVSVLMKKVVKWTGWLAGTVSVEKVGNLTYEIGPDTSRAKYAKWIEDGTTRGRTNFKGYHYVKESVNKFRTRLENQLKRDIEGL